MEPNLGKEGLGLGSQWNSLRTFPRLPPFQEAVVALLSAPFPLPRTTQDTVALEVGKADLGAVAHGDSQGRALSPTPILKGGREV